MVFEYLKSQIKNDHNEKEFYFYIIVGLVGVGFLPDITDKQAVAR
jgi:hypothetical protein